MGLSMLSSAKRKQGRRQLIATKSGIKTFCKPFSPLRRGLVSGSRATRTALTTAMTSSTSLLSKTFQQEESDAVSSTNDTIITIDKFTKEAMRIEVLDLLAARYDNGYPSLYAVASALANSSSVMAHYTNASFAEEDTSKTTKNNNNTKSGYETATLVLQNLSKLSLKDKDSSYINGSSSSSVLQRQKVRQRQLKSALKKIENQVGSSSKQISSWKEAEKVLSTVVIFSVEQDDNKEDKKHPVETTNVATLKNKKRSGNHPDDSDNAVQQYLQRIQEATRNLMPFSHTPGHSKWKQVAQTSLPKKFSQLSIPKTQDEQELVVDDEKAAALEEEFEMDMIRKLDTQHSKRIDSMLEVRNASLLKDSAAVQIIDGKYKKIIDDKAAKNKALQLLTPLTKPQKELVHNAIYGSGSDSDILAQVGTDSVQRESMKRLQPGQWLNDEVIHYFMVMLSKRDEELCKKVPTRKRSHFFKSFFMTKLLDEGNANPAKAGKYDYKNVKRWSKKVPGKDIFALDKIFFPINVGGVHWVCAVAYITQRKIQMYDSMGSSGMHYLESIFEYLKDEHKAKKNSPLPDMDQWKIEGCTSDTPTQRNGFDCGVFTCMFADFLSTDCPLSFSQTHINECRERIALSIMNGSAMM